jgi:two-component system cell cycle sensor histidine kinase/response regulator CckA
MAQTGPSHSEGSNSTQQAGHFSRRWLITAAIVAAMVATIPCFAHVRLPQNTILRSSSEMVRTDPLLIVLTGVFLFAIAKLYKCIVRTRHLEQATAELEARARSARENDEHRQVAEEALRESKARLRSLVDRAPFGICRSGYMAERFETVNPAFCEMLGYTEQELLNLSLATQVYANPDERAQFNELLRRTRRLQGHELTFLRKDGRPIRLRVSAVLTSQNGKSEQVEAYIEDLTEQSALEQQIRAVQKLEAVGRLAGGVAHDFNNILVVIKLSTEMMLNQITPESGLSKPLLHVSNAADRATALTKQLLAFSRRQVMQLRVVNVNAVVNDAAHFLRRIIGEDIQLITDMAHDLANTRLDPDQLGQVIMNLAVNARDAMPGGGTLRIETANVELDETYARSHPPVQPGSYVLLTFSDSGTGIAKSDLPRVFDPFFTTKELGKGTGLGLSIVYGIVKQSG